MRIEGVTELVAQEGFPIGAQLYIQTVSSKSAVYLRRTALRPASTDRGIRIGFENERYPVEVLESPNDKIWVWPETGDVADIAFYLHQGTIVSPRPAGWHFDIPDIGT